MPASDLPDATVGDIVVMKGDDGGEERTGTIVETRDRNVQRFFRLELH